MRKVETKQVETGQVEPEPTITTEFDLGNNDLDPFGDPVAYLAHLGIEVEMISFVEADLPRAA